MKTAVTQRSFVDTSRTELHPRRIKNVTKTMYLMEYITLRLYRVSQEERTELREGVPYVKLYRYNPKHLCPKLNGFRDNGK